jgi:hypothetical protein
MYLYQYFFMALYIGVYVFYQYSGAPMPAFWPTVNTYVSWAFLLVALFFSGRVVVDCLLLHARGEMTTHHMTNGILLAVLNFLPSLLMSVFMLRQGFAGPAVG